MMLLKIYARQFMLLKIHARQFVNDLNMKLENSILSDVDSTRSSIYNFFQMNELNAVVVHELYEMVI